MFEAKYTELFKVHSSGKKPKTSAMDSAQETRRKGSVDQNQINVPKLTLKFEQNEYKSLWEKSLADLYLNLEENVELNFVLSKIQKRSLKTSGQNFQEKLELSFRNSLKKNSVQRNSIRRFMTLLFGDLHSALLKKNVG